MRSCCFFVFFAETQTEQIENLFVFLVLCGCFRGLQRDLLENSIRVSGFQLEGLSRHSKKKERS